MNRILRWLEGRMSKKQCDNLYSTKGGRVYCCRRKGHFGKCKNFWGRELTGTIINREEGE